MAAPSQTPAKTRRTPVDLEKLTSMPALGRLAIMNHFSRKVAELSGQSRFPMLSAFLPQNLVPWITSYLKFAFSKKYPFPDYAGSGKTGVYKLARGAGSNAVKIAVAGDWATGTQEAATIAGLISKTQPDLTIHLGDVYYVGDENEIQENCFGRSEHGYAGVTWPHGSQGSLALNGNHEMYANGKPYFTTFLSSLGCPGGTGQIASFFCLEIGQWRIIGIDTGYNSIGIPILSQIPGLNHVSFVGGDCTSRPSRSSGCAHR